MAIATNITHPCPRCGQPVEAVLHRSFVIEDDASLRDILENRFHVLDCSKCGERRTFDTDFLVTNRKRDMFVQVVTRDEAVPKMIEDMRDLLRDHDVFARIVPNRDALVEKVKLRMQKLDDVAIEVMKFFVRIQIHDLEGKSSRHYDRLEADKVFFTVRMPEKGVAVIDLPIAVYHNIIRDLETAAHARELEVDERLARRLLDEEKARKKGGSSGAPATSSPAVAGANTSAGGVSKQPLAVTHAGTDRRGRRFVSDGKIILLNDYVTSTKAEAPAVLTTENLENLLGQKATCWTPIADLVKSKLHAGAYRTSDDVALGEAYVSLLLALGKKLDLGSTGRMGAVLLRDGAEIVGALMPLNLPPEKAASPNPASAAEPANEGRTPCPTCRGLLPRGDRFCEACGVGLAWSPDGSVSPSYPELSPGRILVSESFETRPFPGRSSLEEHSPGVMEAKPQKGGKLATYHRAVTSSFVDYARPLRDACVRATFTPLDPGVRVGLCARHSIIGGIQMLYLFDVMPLAGRAWCSRGVQAPQNVTSTRLGPEVNIEPVAIGTPIELELRVAGTTLRAFVNGRPVMAVHDASFGAGGFGIRVAREHDIAHPVRILCHGYEVREVMP